MQDFRQGIAERVCGVVQPRHILLAGGRDHALARILAEAAAPSNATLHIAARERTDWMRALQRELGESCVLHEAAAADAISVLPVPELCWVDADPNWFTTHSILAAQARRLGKPFPVTIIEAAGWPYGRRDSYDDPRVIPPSMRQPHERAGILPGRATLAGAAGFHGERFNATQENEPGNGVLTAVEDFMSGRTAALRLVTLHGFGGLAVISPRTGPGAGTFDAAGVAADALAIAASLERVRLDQTVQLQALQAALHHASSLRDAEHLELQELRAEMRRTRRLQETLLAAAQAHGRARDAQVPTRRSLREAFGIVRPGLRHEPAAKTDDADIDRLRQSPVFDAAWYLASYSDVAATGIDPATHYLRHGAAELRDPGPSFSTAYYYSEYPDVAAAGINPLLHYLTHGASEGRKPQ